MSPEELFPGFKVPPNDPSREVKRPAVTWVGNITESQPRVEMDDDDYRDDGDEWCDTCANTGSLDCHCGGDLCVCRWNGERPCPSCAGY